MDALIKHSGNEIDINNVKDAIKKGLGEKGFNAFFSNMPNDSFGTDKGDVADETIYFRKGASKSTQKNRTENAMAKGAKLRSAPKADDIGFGNIVKAAQELYGNNKGGLAKKTKGFKQGGLAGQGHNDMRKGGLFK